MYVYAIWLVKVTKKFGQDEKNMKTNEGGETKKKHKTAQKHTRKNEHTK